MKERPIKRTRSGQLPRNHVAGNGVMKRHPASIGRVGDSGTVNNKPKRKHK